MKSKRTGVSDKFGEKVLAITAVQKRQNVITNAMTTVPTTNLQTSKLNPHRTTKNDVSYSISQVYPDNYTIEYNFLSLVCFQSTMQSCDGFKIRFVF